MSNEDKKLDTTQVAYRLGISRRSVYRLIHAGELRAASYGPVWGTLVRESAVDEFERRREEESACDNGGEE